MTRSLFRQILGRTDEPSDETGGPVDAVVNRLPLSPPHVRALVQSARQM